MDTSTDYLNFLSLNAQLKIIFIPPEDLQKSDTFIQQVYHNMIIFERKIFRRIYGPKYENGAWKSRTNRELEEMSKGENIVKWIKGQRIG